MSWQTVNLGDVCSLVNGKAYNAQDWSTEGLPIIRIQNLNDGDKPFNYWNGSPEKEVHVSDDDILLAWSGTPGTSFGAHIWRRGRGVLNQHFFRVDIDRNKITAEWAVTCINHQLYRLIGQAHGGVGLQHVTKPMVQGLRIPLPPVPEQRRLASILDRADSIRRKREQGIGLTEELLRSTFLEMFGDPVTNPKGWETAEIGSLCRLVRGSSPRPKGDPRYYNGPVKRLMVEDLTRDGLEVFAKIDSLTEERATLSRPVPSGTIVLVVSGNVGLPAKVMEAVCIHDGFVGLLDLDNSKVRPDYLLHTLLLIRVLHERNKAGAIWQNLTTDQVKATKVPLPALSEQDRFLAVVSLHGKVADARKRLFDHTDLLFCSLVQRAFRGEL